VQVPFDTPTRFVGRGDDSCPRRCERGATVRDRDRGRDEVGEVEHPLLGVRRQRLAPRRNHDDSPQISLDDDRRSELAGASAAGGEDGGDTVGLEVSDQGAVAVEDAATSCATAEKSSAGATPRATSVAIRRSAACSEVSRASWQRRGFS
jgi:hypothetical protein